MQYTPTLKGKTMQFIRILLPVLITQVGLFAMNFFDIMMSGHASSSDLAGVAIGSSIWVPIYTGLSGILLALTPIVAQHLGAGRKKEIAFSVIQAVYLGITISLIVIISGSFFLDPLLQQMKLEPFVRQVAHDYLAALSMGIVPLFVYNVFRCFIDALGQTRVTMTITLASLPINIFLNYLFIFGKFGFPKLGGVGTGYATAITYWCSCIMAIFIILRNKPFVGYEIFKRFYTISFKEWKTLLQIGIPIGFSIFFETSIFAAVTLLMSEFDTVTIAAHQSAMNFASLLYMIPLSISMTLTIAIGFEVGAKRFVDAKQYSFLGIGIAVFMAVLTSLFLFFFRGEVASMYTQEREVFELAKQFLLYAIFFQLSDAVAAPIQGALRGYKDVNSTFFMSFVSYWIIGLPLGYLLANFTSAHAFGYWIGLITGLAAGALFLFTRLLFIQRRFARQSANIKSA
ncbi:MATE family multidrug resistance protein [Anoxybacillus calidus]|jgi:multidrug resistance protein, MATE family|uniref:Probable multidrug resistance protein NorM n=1 Tax=[Anoxybacillus] calidus TaxID=575178 RepID=A0A7V9YY93_9BACL|nr:MATE family efflux transporter [Anoxybacillus calidus]MBA2870455.1 MATE family multidrug resistance protein [Anoxybacillus calidus]